MEIEKLEALINIPNRENFGNLVIFTIVLYFISISVLFFSYKKNFLFLFLAGNLLRILFFTSNLSLSDDFNRFLWDGFMVDQFFDPYSISPIQVATESIPENLLPIFEKLNSKEFYSVYPMVSEGIFWLVYKLGYNETSWILFFRSIVWVFELGILGILYKMEKQKGTHHLYSGIFFLSPYILMESFLNLHLETFMAFFILLAIYYFEKQKQFLQIFYSALATLVKPSSLLLVLPPAVSIIRDTNSRKKYFKDICLLFTALLIFCFSFFISKNLFFTQVEKGYGLFFHSFQFNSIFYKPLYSFFQLFSLGYTTGIFLNSIAGGIFLYLLFRFRKSEKPIQEILPNLLWVMIFLSVLHPWYLLPFFVVSLYYQLSTKIFLVWSVASLASYKAYSSPAFFETWVVTTILVLTYLYEKRKKSISIF